MYDSDGGALFMPSLEFFDGCMQQNNNIAGMTSSSFQRMWIASYMQTAGSTYQILHLLSLLRVSYLNLHTFHVISGSPANCSVD